MAYFPVKKKKGNVGVKHTKESEIHYDIEPINSLNADINIILSQRNLGKTYAIGKQMLTDYWNNKLDGCLYQSAYVRRWKDDMTMNNCRATFTSLIHNSNGENTVSTITHGAYTNIVYKTGAWYLANYDENLQKDILDTTPFCFAYSLSEVEHTKGTERPFVFRVYFDEFIPIRGHDNNGHMVGEFKVFSNLISTIMREKTDFKVYMLANTLNVHDIYFDEFGLYHVTEQAVGTIELYDFGKDVATIAVELCAPKKRTSTKQSNDRFFAFDNPELKMITGGSWSYEIHPHLPYKYNRSDICGEFFVAFHDALLHCEIIAHDDDCFIYVHNKTTPVDDDDTALIYTPEYNPRPNWRRNILKPFSEPERRILTLIKMDKVYYQDNPIGEIFTDYIEWCKN